MNQINQNLKKNSGTLDCDHSMFFFEIPFCFHFSEVIRNISVRFHITNFKTLKIRVKSVLEVNICSVFVCHCLWMWMYIISKRWKFLGKLCFQFKEQMKKKHHQLQANSFYFLYHRHKNVMDGTLKMHFSVCTFHWFSFNFMNDINFDNISG